jgi:dTDP-4-dehydrorhamnose 3,5-epimerase-like enzyme
MVPKIINGGSHSDERGTLRFNNSFDVTDIKRMYMIENKDATFVRGWQGHRIEQRWFSVSQGSFKIELIVIDNWENPSKKAEIITYILDSEKLDILHVPKGCISSIQALSIGSKLLVMSDYRLNEINDEYRFSSDYFE